MTKRRRMISLTILWTSKKVLPGNVFPSCALMKVIPSWANWFQRWSQHRILVWQWSVRWWLLVFHKGQRKVGGCSECTYEYGDLHHTSKVFDWNMAKGCRLLQQTCGSHLDYVPGSPPNGNWRDGTVFLWYPARSIERLRDSVRDISTQSTTRKTLLNTH